MGDSEGTPRTEPDHSSDDRKEAASPDTSTPSPTSSSNVTVSRGRPNLPVVIEGYVKQPGTVGIAGEITQY
jgi:hypothetical protein